jgi:hypothetical protein
LNNLIRIDCNQQRHQARNWAGLALAKARNENRNGSVLRIGYSLSFFLSKWAPLNRVTNMVDAAGTTLYSYAIGGQL